MTWLEVRENCGEEEEGEGEEEVYGGLVLGKAGVKSGAGARTEERKEGDYKCEAGGLYCR
jgi:hypothetical protein